MLEEVHREQWARLVAALTRRFGSLDIAEEAAAEAFAAAVEHWRDGPPPNPGGWLMTTAQRRAIDRLRREKRGAQIVAGGGVDFEFHTPDGEPAADGPVADDRLRLIFTCCHPALAPEARIALTLRLLGGLTVPDIARALLKSEAAVGQRITRAKAKIAAAQIPYRVPSERDLPERLDAVLTVIYLIFNEGYLPAEVSVRVDLCAEALRLARLVHQLLPSECEPAGLLTLLLLAEARRPSRVSADGELVPLQEQDRGGWDRALIAQGHALVRGLIAAGVTPGRFALQAAIASVHTYARDFRDTDWAQLSTLYDQLFAIDPSPVVALNRAVMVAELDGPAVALSEVDRLTPRLAGYHAFHATRADLLRRLGRSAEARDAYTRAIELAANPAERRYLGRRRASLATSGPGTRSQPPDAPATA